MAPDVPLYNEAVTIHRNGSFSLHALERAFNAVISRHEMWRSSIEMRDGRLLIVVKPELELKLPLVDLTDRPEEEREAAALHIATEDARLPFDLACAPLLRARVVRLAPDRHRLYLVLHHIIFDGVSIYRLIVPELTALYTAYAAGKEPDLAAPSLQYGDYAIWRQRQFGSKAIAQQLNYWREKLSGELPQLQLPTDRKPPSAPTHRGAMETFRLCSELTNELKKFSRNEGVTLYVTLLAAFKTMLYRWSGQEDIVIGGVTDMRHRPELERVVGYFLNSVALRTRPRAATTFRDYLHEVQRTVIEALDASDVPFDRVVREIAVKRDGSRHPLFQVSFSIEPPMPDFPDGWDLTQMDVPIGTAKFDLYLELDEKNGGIIGRFLYDIGLFEAPTIRRMIGHWQTLLRGIIQDPQCALAKLPMLTPEEHRQILVDWNETRVDYPNRCVHELFEEQVLRTPESIALISGESIALISGERLTFSDLNRRANRLAHRLRARGVGPEVLVGICLERSIDMIVGVLGILKAGGGYLPLDPNYPDEHLAFQLADARPSVVLTRRELASRVASSGVAAVSMDGETTGTVEREDNPEPGASPGNVAYVIYTSGSTGRPKGVLIPHRGLVNYLSWAIDAYDVAAGTGAPLHTPLSFDLTITSLFLPLLAGRAVILVPEGEGLHGLSTALHASNDLSPLKITPAHLTLLSRQLAEGRAAECVRVFVIGGEALSWESLTFWQEHAPNGRFFNEYGPTETVVGCCVYEATGQTGQSGAVPIGRPIANTQLYVLDGQLEPVPVGAQGELYIGGAGVGRGYLNRPELTAERFIPDRFSDTPGARLYKTGDLARYRSDGNLEFCGRIDEQIKVRGYRIEPGEIEAVLEEHPAIGRAVVMAAEASPGDKYLVAFWEPRAEAALSVAELRRYLADRLPAHMVPSAISSLPTLPTTPNGKIDRRALAAASRLDLLATESELVPPRDELEADLVRMWEEVLSLKPIGVTHDFFQLGGHSLLAVELFARIEERLGVTLPLATLFEAPTIADLAGVLRGGTGPVPQRSLVAIRRGGSQPPLFAVPGVGGSVIYYQRLARLLGDDQPFYGLESQGLDGFAQPLTRIEDIAAVFLRAIRTVQSEGPYYLLGACIGGVVAWEIAQQLLVEGQEVGFFAMLGLPQQDSKARGGLGPRALAIRELMMGRLRLYGENFRRLRGRQRFEYLRQRISALSQLIRRRNWTRGNRAELYREIVTQANLLAFRRYAPRPYAGPVVVFRARRSNGADDYAQWRELAEGGVEVHTVSGDNSGLMLVEPHVQVVAAELKACLERARAEAPERRLRLAFG
jgi:amino acid adenylation domain-containing protein